MPWSKSQTEKPAVKEELRTTIQKQASPLVIGIEFDRAKIVAALVNESGRVIDEHQSEMPQRTTRAAVGAMTKLMVALASSPSRAGSPVNAIGFSVAGLVDPPTGRVSLPELKGWTRVALQPMVEEALTEAGVDIRIAPNEKRARARHSDSAHPAMAINSRAAAIAAGEAWVGAARGKNNVVYLRVGEEIEAGIFAEGRVVRGATGQAGAAGWLAVGENFKPEFESRGCLTTEAAMGALKRRAIEEWDGGAKSVIGHLIRDDATQLDAATIIRAARGGDGLALKVVNETCRWLGRGVANLISILNPDAVVIGGENGLLLKPYLDEVREEAFRWAMPAAARQCRIVIATLGGKAGVIGAARLAFLKAAVE
jgi:glucokinase